MSNFQTINGSQTWWENGRLHRKDGPALTSVNGTKFWYYNGSLHREDGPAVVKPGGEVVWWYKGVKYPTFKEYASVAIWTDTQQANWLLGS